MEGAFELRIGQVVDGLYRIDGRLGKGGMGTVYSAFDSSRGVAVALKVLSPDLVSARDVKRFEREAQLAARVGHHAGVVRVHAFGRVDGLPYCVMELVSGVDLEQELDRGRMDEDRLCEVLEAVARALALCHAEGVVHRDLKPANILLPTTGGPKVVDFGLARGGHDDRLTATGEMVGTPSYMAPEQAVDGARAVEPSVDIYSLGAILYHGLTGVPPFQGPSVLQTLYQVANVEPTPPSKLSAVSPNIEAVCLRAMAKVPEDRYANMQALAEDLLRARQGRPVEARKARAWSGFSGRLARRELPALGAAVFAVSLVVVAVLGAGWLALDRSGPERARALLADYRAFDGQECAHTSACPQGEHVLFRYALGLGDGPAPKTSELERYSERLEVAKRYLDEAGIREAEEARVRVLAHARLLEGQPSGKDPTSLLALALVEAGRGDLRGARSHLGEALDRQKVPRVAGEVWARVWQASLDERGIALAAECLRSLPDEDSQATQSVIEHAATLWARAAAAAALEGESPARIRARASGIKSALPRAASVLAAAKRSELARSSADWGTTIRNCSSAQRSVGLTGRAGLVVLFQRLKASLSAEPEISLVPELCGQLQAIFAEASEGGGWALALDSAVFYELGWQLKPHSGYLAYLEAAMLRTDLPKEAAQDVLLSTLRHGVRKSSGDLYTSKLVAYYNSDGVDRQMRFAHPESRAARFLSLVSRIRKKRKTADVDTRSQLIEAAQDTLYRERLIEDLSLAYRAEALVLYAKLLDDQVSEMTDGDEPTRDTALGQTISAVCAEAIAIQEISMELLNEAYSLGAKGLRLQGLGDEITAFLATGLQRVRDRIPEVRQDGPLGQVQDVLEVFLDLLGEAADHARGPAKWALIQEALQIAEEFPRGAGCRLSAVVDASEYVRKHNRDPAGAESLLTPYFEVGYAEPIFVREAARVARDGGELKKAIERVERGLLYRPGDVRLEKVKEDLNRKLRKEASR